jgi:hypothetical protein
VHHCLNDFPYSDFGFSDARPAVPTMTLRTFYCATVAMLATTATASTHR